MSESATSRTPNLPHCRRCSEVYSFKKKVLFLPFFSNVSLLYFFFVQTSKVDLKTLVTLYLVFNATLPLMQQLHHSHIQM